MLTKGYDVEQECRICLREPETIQHFLGNHVPYQPGLTAPIHPALKRKISQICKSENTQLRQPNKRLRLNPDPEIVRLITRNFPQNLFTCFAKPKFRKKCYPSKRRGAPGRRKRASPQTE